MNAPLRHATLASGLALSIVHIVRQYRPNTGGLEDVVDNLTREQLRAGHHPRVVTLDRLFRDPDVTLPAEDVIGGVPVRRIPYRGSSRYPLAPSVMNHLGGADVIHVHAVDFFFDAIALARPWLKAPLVATTHGGIFHTADFSKLKSLWFNGPTRTTARLYDALVACSPSDARTFRKLVPDAVTLIENGADLRKFAGASSPTPVKRMATLGRFSKNKRPDKLIAAFARLVREDPDWRLDLIGAESDWTAAELNALIDAAGLTEKATVHVGLDNAAVARTLGAASLFVSASDYEGFGVALIEAMSAGLAPVVHPNEAFAGLAARHPAIRLVDFADAEAAAEAVRASFAALVSDPSKARVAPAELAPYAWRGVAAAYEDVYRAAIEKRNGPDALVRDRSEAS